MSTVPILGTDLCPKDSSLSLLHTFQSGGSESKPELMEKICIVQESVSKSEYKSESSNGNKLLQNLKKTAM